MELQAHHRRAIDRLVDEYTEDSRFPALIIGGSVAKGCARPDSDVDFLIVATDEEFNLRRTQNDLFINRTDLCDYDGGYVDGKAAELLSHINALLEDPNAENGDALFQSVKTYRDWGVSDIDAYTWFMTEVEWAWMDGMAPMEDW